MTDIDKELDNINSSSNELPEPFKNPIPEKYLGHIAAMNMGLKVGRNENLIYAVIEPSERERVEVGDYIRIPYYRPDLDEDEREVNKQLLASVESLSYGMKRDDRQFTSADSFGAEQYRLLGRNFTYRGNFT
ncbi:MAG: hypothetical protein U5Q16_13580 [Gammaproteobacteria bacterium]|nr:hypothetical protein [Gammaproteobacteria bacterium]